MRLTNTGSTPINISSVEVWAIGAEGSRPAQPPRPPGWFTVTPQGRILDPNGDDFLMIGTNVNGPQSFFWRCPIIDIDLIADAWQFNTIRIITGMGMYFGTPHLNLDDIVDAFTARGIVAMIEVHDYTGTFPGNTTTSQGLQTWYSLPEFTQHWVQMAERFNDNPYVWFNIMNEPGDERWSPSESAQLWHDIHAHIIEAIREVAPHNVIVLDEHNWGQGWANFTPDMNDILGPASAILNRGPSLNAQFHNLVYSIHPYHWTREHMMRAFFEETGNQGLALILGELGADIYYMELATFQSTMHAFNLGLEFGIGILHWGWEDPRFPLVDPDSVPGRINSNTGAREAGFGFEIDRTDGTRPTNLSWMGELFWDWTRGDLTVPVPIYEWPLLLNGDFENGILGWMPWFGGVVVPTGSDREGYNYISFSQVSWGGLFNSQQLDEITYNHYASLGKTFRLSAYGRIQPAGLTQPLQISYRLTCSPDVERFVNLEFDSPDWTHNYIEFTLPDNLYSIQLLVHSFNSDKVFSLSNIVIELVINEEPPELW